MDKEMLYRIKTAGEYQWKALRALFPEEMEGHLDVIEKEIKMMVIEAANELVKACNKRDDCEDTKDHEKVTKARKVNIM